MNERIEELAKVARTWAENKFDKNQQAPGFYYHVDVVEKFAELLIKECAEVAEDYDGAHYVGTAIKQHFGVEE